MITIRKGYLAFCCFALLLISAIPAKADLLGYMNLEWKLNSYLDILMNLDELYQSAKLAELVETNLLTTEESGILSNALSGTVFTARLNVLVTEGETPKPDANVAIKHMAEGVQSDILQGMTDNDGKISLILLGVPEYLTDIILEVSGVAGYDPVSETVAVLAFATVNLEIDLTTGGAPGPGPAPVPEPATIILLGTGLLGLAGASRRKVQEIVSISNT